MKNKYMIIIVVFIFCLVSNIIISQGGKTIIGVTPSIIVNKISNSNNEIEIELTVINKSEFDYKIPENNKNEYNIIINFSLNKANSTINNITCSENNFVLKPGEHKKIKIKAYSTNATKKETVFYIDVTGKINKNNNISVTPIVTIPVYYIDKYGPITQVPGQEVTPESVKPNIPKEDLEDNLKEDLEDNLKEDLGKDNISGGKLDVNFKPEKDNSIKPSEIIDKIYEFSKNLIKEPIKTLNETKDEITAVIFYKPIELNIKDLKIYDIKKIRYNKLINTISDNKKVMNKKIYTLVSGNKNFDLLVDSISFTDTNVVFKSGELETQLNFPKEEILISVKNQIKTLEQISNNRLTIKYLLENINVPKNINYQPIKINLEAEIKNSTNRSVYAFGKSRLVSKQDIILAEADFKSKIIKPYKIDSIYSEIQVDTKGLKSGLYKIKNYIQFLENDEVIEKEKNVIFLSVRTFVYLLISISVFWMSSLIINNIKLKHKIKIKQFKLISEYNNQELNIDIYENINTDFFFDYIMKKK